MSYTNVFGGYNINTAFPSYKKYTFDANLQLTWASSFVDNSNVAAQINDMEATDVFLGVYLADATQLSVGQTIQFNNVGDNLFTIYDFLGGEIFNIPPVDDNQIILYLQDNTTKSGIWGITHLGSGTSSADASALAGFGTIALNSKLNTNFPGKKIGVDYQVLISDRASILVWTGGSGTITLPPQLDGFPVAVNNSGTGAVVIATSDGSTIDGEPSFSINPSESSYFIGVELNWNTLGFGVESFFQVNVLSPLNLSAVGPSITLTPQQSSRLVEQFTGALTQDVTVYYPAAAGQWYVWNNTTGPHTVTAQLSGPVGNPVQVPQGEKIILYSDGTSIYSTPTISTSAIFPDGTVGAPGINFTAQNSTGFYRIGSGLVGYSSAGTQGLTFGGPTPGYGLGISGGLEQRYYNGTNTNYVGFEAGGALVGDTIWTLPLTDSIGTQALVSNGFGVLSWKTLSNVTSVNGTPDRITVANPTTTPTIDIAANYVGQASITTLGTITTGIWNGTVIDVAHGGTGSNTFTAPYKIIISGASPTSPLLDVGAGNLFDILSYNGVASPPIWSNRSAVKLDQVTATSTVKFVTPAVQQFHPSSSKFWCKFLGTTPGTNPPIAGYNVISVTRVADGTYDINFTVPFNVADYVVIGNCQVTGIFSALIVVVQHTNLTTCRIKTVYGASNTLQDVGSVYVAGFGGQ